MLRATFLYILEHIRCNITKESVTEEPISPELRLVICLYPLGRGDYLFINNWRNDRNSSANGLTL